MSPFFVFSFEEAARPKRNNHKNLYIRTLSPLDIGGEPSLSYILSRCIYGYVQMFNLVLTKRDGGFGRFTAPEGLSANLLIVILLNILYYNIVGGRITRYTIK